MRRNRIAIVKSGGIDSFKISSANIFQPKLASSLLQTDQILETQVKVIQLNTFVPSAN